MVDRVSKGMTARYIHPDSPQTAFSVVDEKSVRDLLREGPAGTKGVELTIPGEREAKREFHFIRRPGATPLSGVELGSPESAVQFHEV